MSQALRLRIEGDGTIFGTRVFDTVTGAILPVQAVTWSIDTRQTGPNVATAIIVVPYVEIAVDALAEIERGAAGC